MGSVVIFSSGRPHRNESMSTKPYDIKVLSLALSRPFAEAALLMLRRP
jgi:hypothetical protein